MTSPGRAALVWVVVLAGCSKSGPPTGTEGGPCYSNRTCHAGLTCLGGLCAVPMERPAPRIKKPEAVLQLEKIGRKARREFLETTTFPLGTAAQLPKKPGRGGCCGGMGKLPNHCLADFDGFLTDPVWRDLDFQIDQDTLFYYDYTGAATSFTAKATGDLDCDGTEIVYTLVGTLVNGIPAFQLIEPAPGAD